MTLGPAVEALGQIPVPLAVERGKLGGTLNEVLLDALLRHRHELYLVENGLVRKLVRPIMAGRDELRKALNSIGAPYFADLSAMPSTALHALEREIGTVMAGMETAVTSNIRQALSDVARIELAAQDALLQGAIPKAVGWQPWQATTSDIAGILETPFKGSLWHQRLARGAAETQITLTQTARSARAGGVTGRALDLRFGKVLEGSYQARAVGLFRTEVGRVANDALFASYRRNAQTVQKVVWVATLDAEVCLVCASRDGMEFDPTAGGMEYPPVHPGCRCFMAPVLKSWEQMGLQAEDLMPRERMAMDGRVPGAVKYPEWFARQDTTFQRDWLGPSRFELYTNGGLEIKDMVKSFRVLPLSELPGGAKAAAAVAATGAVGAATAAKSKRKSGGGS